MFVRLFLLLASFFTISYMSAAERFPYLSRLPKASLVRQRCLKGKNDWFFKGPVQIACEELEKDCKYLVENGGRGRPRSLDELSYDENVDMIMVPDENPRSRTTMEEAMRFRGINPKDERAYDKYAETVYREQIETTSVLYLYSIIKWETEAKSCEDTKRIEGYAQNIAKYKNKMEAMYAAENATEKS